MMNGTNSSHRVRAASSRVKTPNRKDGPVTAPRASQDKNKKSSRNSNSLPIKKTSSGKKSDKTHKDSIILDKSLQRSNETEILTNNNEGEEEFNSMLTYDIITSEDTPQIVKEEKEPKKTKFLSRIFGNSSTKKNNNSRQTTIRNNRKNSTKRETRLPKALNHKLHSLEDLRNTSQLNNTWNTFPRSISTVNVSSPPTFIPVFKRSSLSSLGPYAIFPFEEKKGSRG